MGACHVDSVQREAELRLSRAPPAVPGAGRGEDRTPRYPRRLRRGQCSRTCVRLRRRIGRRASAAINVAAIANPPPWFRVRWARKPPGKGGKRKEACGWPASPTSSARGVMCSLRSRAALFVRPVLCFVSRTRKKRGGALFVLHFCYLVVRCLMCALVHAV